MLPLSKTTTVDSQNKSDFDTKWAYDTSIALSSVFKAYPDLDSNEVLVYEKSYVEDVLTTEGIHTSEVHHQVIIHAESITKANDGSRIRDTRSWIVPSREALPSMKELTLELQELAEWTLALRDAPIEDNYLGPVILENMAAVRKFSDSCRSARTTVERGR